MRLLASVLLAGLSVATIAGTAAAQCATSPKKAVITHQVQSYLHGGYGHSGHGSGYTGHSGHYDSAFFPIAVFTPVPLFAVSAPSPAAVAVTEKSATASASAPATSQGSAELREVLEVLRSFDVRLKRLEGGATPPTTPGASPTTPPAPPFTVPPAPLGPMSSTAPAAGGAAHPALIAKCAVCHNEATAGEKGGGLVFFRGGSLVASERWRIKMRNSVEGKRMPPDDSGVTLTPEEKEAIVAALKS